MLLNCRVSFSEFVRSLERLDFTRLPGIEAQLTLAPTYRHEQIRSMGTGQDTAVKSAVMILVYPSSEGFPTTVFIQRPDYDGVHGGQISFPGGRYEEGDVDLKQTALRETYEEIGIPSGQIRVLGKLTDLYIPPSNYLVSPYLGLADHPLQFMPDKNEVEALIEVGICSFLNEGSLGVFNIALRDGTNPLVPCYFVEDRYIWGATAMIMSEFLTMAGAG